MGVFKDVKKAVKKATDPIVKPAVKAVKSVGTGLDKAIEALGEGLTNGLKAVKDGAKEIGKVLDDVVKVVKPYVEYYVINAALVSMGVPPVYAAPMASAAHTMAKGGTPEEALKSAATTALVQNVSKGVSDSMTEANKAATAAGKPPVYTATQISAAASAAGSAVATAAVGGSPEDIIKGAGIGGVSGTVATEVYKQTGSLAAANAARTSTAAVLQGVELKEAILQGASAATVGYLQQIQEEEREFERIRQAGQADYDAYTKRVDDYNAAVRGLEGATTQEEADYYKATIDAALNDINRYSEAIGRTNQALADKRATLDGLNQKAKEEAQKTEFDFRERTQAALEAESQQRQALEDELSRMFAEIEGRRYEGVDIAAGQLPLGIEESVKTVPLLNESLAGQTENNDEIRRSIRGIDNEGNQYTYDIVIDKQTGEVGYEYGNRGVGATRPNLRTPEGIMRIDIEGVAPPSEFSDFQPSLTEEELEAINVSARGGRAGALRGVAESYLFEQELAGFEQELQAAASEAERIASRAEFVRQQRDRLAKTQRLSGTARSQIDAELESILDEYEAAKGEAGRKAATKERIVASQQERAGRVSDEEVMRLLGLSPEEGSRYGLSIGGGGEGIGGLPEGITEAPEEPLEGEMELGGGEGEGEPTEFEEQRFDAQGRPILSTVRIRPTVQRQDRQTPGIPSRVTGEALAGILGEKEPLFGGDEDEQQAVWNRRSLRLRKALGL